MSKDLRDILKEECALAAVIDIPNAAAVSRDMLLVQQHRGEKSTGIVSSNHRNLHFVREIGRVDENFPDDYDFKSTLPGKVAVGHCRYATKGAADDKSNIQPLVFKASKYGQWLLAHNGTLMDTNNIRRKLMENGALSQSTTDSEILAHLIASSKENNLEDAIAAELPKFPTAYSLLIMTKQKVIALRDKYGVRPLSIARLRGGYLLASETCAFRIFDEAEHVRDVGPGEMVIFDKQSVRSGKGFESRRFAEPDEHWCIFEGIYFSDPRSEYKMFMHEDFRQRSGEKVYEENKEYIDGLNADFVIPILDSGKQGAIGFARASGIPYKEYFLRRHNAPKSKGRSYTSSIQSEREFIAHMKLDLRKERIKDKIVITVDDSVVRATTSRENNSRLRNAGAKKVVNVILSPMLISPCYTGMDHQTYEELAAYRYGNEESIARNIGADKVVYLSLKGLHQLVDETYKCGVCSGCFGGKYPIQKNNSRRITSTAHL